MKKINKPTDATKLMLDRIIEWEKDLSEYGSLEGILREQFIIYERIEGATIINELLDSHNERVEEEKDFEKWSKEHDKKIEQIGGTTEYLISQGVDPIEVTKNGVVFVDNLMRLMKAENLLREIRSALSIRGTSDEVWHMVDKLLDENGYHHQHEE